MVMAADYVAATQNVFANLIKKPKFQEKYLRKPPFRFIHDVVTNTMAATGFPEGLFEGSELNGKAIKDKQSKIAWLNKLIRCLESVASESISADPNKIVAGMEPEATNEMLQTFGTIAVEVANGGISMPQILENMKSPPAAADSIEHRESAQQENDAAVHREEPTPKQRASAPSEAAESAPAPNPKSGSLANGGAADTEQWLLDTQRTLGALIERPRLLEKLLRRPPFRFLFDVVRSLIKSTGFPLQFLDEAVDIAAADIKDAKFKFYFLSKLIVIASAATDDDLSSIDPKQIIAGRNPEGTNLLLTRLAEAATSELDVDSIKKRIAAIGQQRASAQRAAKEQRAQKKEAQSRPPLRESAPSANTARVAAPIMPKLELEQLQKTQTQPLGSKQKAVRAAPAKQEEAPSQPPPFQAIQKLQRPRTARRAPPKLKSNVVEEEKGGELQNAAIITDRGDKEDGHCDAEDSERIKELKEDSELQRLGFIEPDDVERDRLERVRRSDGMEDAADGSHGKLVRDILDSQNGIKIENKRLGTHRKDSAQSVERVENMREMIQTLCQTVLPLGKCIDLVFQDMDAIGGEMLKWKQLIAANEDKLARERERTQKILEPLHRQLLGVEESIERQRLLIMEQKAVLLRNETETAELIRKRLLHE